MRYVTKDLSQFFAVKMENAIECWLAAATVIKCGYELLMLMDEENPKRKRPRTKWVRELYAERNNSFFPKLDTMLREKDPALFNNFLRMDAEEFDYLLGIVRPRIEKKDTHFRKAITAAERLAVTLRFLASGDSYSTLMYFFQMSKASIQHIIEDTCNAIYEELK